MAVAAAPVVSMARLTGSIIGVSPDILLVFLLFLVVEQTAGLGLKRRRLAE